MNHYLTPSLLLDLWISQNVLIGLEWLVNICNWVLGSFSILEIWSIIYFSWKLCIIWFHLSCNWEGFGDFVYTLLFNWCLDPFIILKLFFLHLITIAREVHSIPYFFSLFDHMCLCDSCAWLHAFRMFSFYLFIRFSRLNFVYLF